MSQLNEKAMKKNTSSGTRNRRPPRSNQNTNQNQTKRFHMQENLRLVIRKEIQEFLNDEERLTLEFPSSLTNIERGYIHTESKKYGTIKSKSYGHGPDRHLVLAKINEITTFNYQSNLELNNECRLRLFLYLKSHPLTATERQTIEMFLKQSFNSDTIKIQRFGIGSTCIEHLQIPARAASDPMRSSTAGSDKFTEFRQKLPIFGYREHIMKTINKSAVTVITGDTGSGKTTQVPQYILENACARQEKCRIICTQPRRLAAVSISSRVAQERGEELGITVGYQVRLESHVSRGTNLIFTTSGYMLRCLLGDSNNSGSNNNNNNNLFQSVTHIIIDEVHERDKHTDFLLITIKDRLASCPHLKVILMSATIDSNIFTDYFNNCPFVQIPGRQYDVDVMYLESIIELINYRNFGMDKTLKMYVDDMKLKSQKPINIPMITNTENVPVVARTTEIESPTFTTTTNYSFDLNDAAQIEFLNNTLENCYANDNFDQFYYLVEDENVPIDFKHTETGMTALMIAARKGLPIVVDKLLLLGANPNVIGQNDMTALKWAMQLQKYDCVDLLNISIHNYSSAPVATASAISTTLSGSNNNINNIIFKVSGNDGNEQFKIPQSILLDYYQQSIDDNRIDHLLLFRMIEYIHVHLNNGSILIFLPGYDDIVEQKELIEISIGKNKFTGNIKIYTLHGNMKSNDQQSVFERLPNDWRKIILSTNIAETSITIDDVVYVIDCGKVKQKTFDSLSGSTALTSVWISKACAKQRCGRAGRTQIGVCFRLYSKHCHDNMETFALPEILRVPLTEICLNTKMLIRDKPILEFLQKAIQPPNVMNINHSIGLLKTIGALDPIEFITPLGVHLVDLPVDVQYGKSIIYAIILKCLDPILTIVSALSVKDMFVLTGVAGIDANIKLKRKQIANDSMSDHYVVLKLFQEWNEHKSHGRERQFCSENSINSGIMDMICSVRIQLLSYLRSLNLIRPHGSNSIHKLNIYSDNFAAVKACLTAGLYPNICRISQTKGMITSRYEKKIKPHQSSIFFNKNTSGLKKDLLALSSEWLIYDEKSHTNFTNIRNITVVSPLTIALFTGPFHLPAENLVNYSESQNENSDSDNDDDRNLGGGGAAASCSSSATETPTTGSTNNNNNSNKKCMTTKLIIDDWIQFFGDTDAIYFTFHLRQKFNALFLKYIQNPTNFEFTYADNTCIETIVALLKEYDLNLKFKHPDGVGKRPSTVNLKFAPCYNYGIRESPSTSSSTATTPGGDYGAEYPRNPQTQQEWQQFHESFVRGNYEQNVKQVAGLLDTMMPSSFTFADIAGRSAAPPTSTKRTAQTTTPTTKNSPVSQSNQSHTNKFHTQSNANKNKFDNKSTTNNSTNNNNNNSFDMLHSRFFIVRVQSKAQVDVTLDRNQWIYPIRILRKIFSDTQNSNADKVILFYLDKFKKFYGIAKLNGNFVNNYSLSCIQTNELLLQSLRNTCNINYSIDDMLNGQEVDQSTGQLIFKSLLYNPRKC